MKNLLTGNKDSLTKKASYLRLVAAGLAESMKLGGFRSLYKGQGIEFSGVRDYIAGDDVRSIDWNVTARMSKPYIKMFDEEHELEMFLIVDRSASMFTGSKDKVKYETAAEIAAILSIAAELNDSPVGAVMFDGEIHFTSVPESGREQTMLLLSKLDEAECRVSGSALSNAITGACKILKKHSLVFIISDFRCDGWQKPFMMLSQKHDVQLIRVTEPSELELPLLGTVPITDVETKTRLVLPTSSEKFKSKWREAYRTRIEKLKDFAMKHGAGFASISTEEDVVRILSRLFMARGNKIK